MPAYDCRCDANGRTLEVRHAMGDKLRTWGELCTHLGIDTGATVPGAPVLKIISGGAVVRTENLGSGQAPPCETGRPCCGGGFCEN